MKKNRKGEIGYKIIRFLLKPLFLFYYKPQLINKHLIPKEGPIIFVGNHYHLFDQCLPLVCTKRTVHYMAKKEYFAGLFAWFFKMAGCISVNRQDGDKEAVERAVEILNDGGAIGIFPEGTRNKTEEFLLPFKVGAVKMAQATGASIVPFGITGHYKWRSKDLILRFGQPFKVGTDDDLEEANKKLWNVISSLKQENLKNQP